MEEEKLYVVLSRDNGLVCVTKEKETAEKQRKEHMSQMSTDTTDKIKQEQMKFGKEQKMKETKEVVKPKVEAPAVIPPPQPQQYAEEILSDSIQIPRLLLMQGLSDFVTAQEAKIGELVRTSDRRKFSVPCPIIPITFNNLWAISERHGNKYKWTHNEPLTAANQKLLWEWTEGKQEFKRTKCMNLFCISPDELKTELEERKKMEKGEAADPSKCALPMLISFRATSYPAGAAIMTLFQKAKRFNAFGYQMTVVLRVRQETNDDGTFHVLEALEAGTTPKELIPLCKEWYDTLTTKKVQVDEVESLEELVLGERQF